MKKEDKMQKEDNMHKEEKVLRGFITWYNWTLGFGLIKVENTERYIVLHQTQIPKTVITHILTWYKMGAKQKLFFDISHTEHGARAINIRFS